MKQIIRILILCVLLNTLSTLFAATPSGSLPVLYINTEGGAAITSKEVYVNASYYLDPKTTGAKAIGTADAPLDMEIRGRGNYTWKDFEKKPYRLKLADKQALLGLEKSKHWALLAHADDTNGFLRNAVGFQLSRLIGMPWTPADAPVEVVLNGDYIGLYFLTETIRVDKKRVNIYDYDSTVEDAQDALATGTGTQAEVDAAVAADPGWLVEIDNYDDPEQVKITETGGETMRFTYDSPADFITEAHRQWLINEMTGIDAMIYADNKDNCTWAEKIDLTDLAKFIIVNQLTKNYESFHGSCKMYRDNAEHAATTGTDTKWHFGLVWDFGSAFLKSDNNMFWDLPGAWHNYWVGEMYKYPALKEKMKSILEEFTASGNYETIYEYIDTYIANITQAAASDKERWQSKGYGNDNLTDKASYVKSFLQTSLKELTAELNANVEIEIPVELYLRGSFDQSWSALDAYKFSHKKENGELIYTLKTASLPACEFKIADSNWGEDYGTLPEAEITPGTPTILQEGTGGDGNCILATAIENATFTFNHNTKSLLITTDTEGGIYTLYNNEIKIYASAGKIFIDSPTDTTINIYSIDGKTFAKKINAGKNIISGMAKGIYIINGKKVVL